MFIPSLVPIHSLVSEKNADKQTNFSQILVWYFQILRIIVDTSKYQPLSSFIRYIVERCNIDILDYSDTDIARLLLCLRDKP